LRFEIEFAFTIFAAHSFDVMSDRQLILEAVQQMPEQASAEEILDEIAMLASIQRGRQQIKRGEGIPHEEVVKRFNSWITESSGRRKH
jgi:predicted transcriptional regulator